MTLIITEQGKPAVEAITANRVSIFWLFACGYMMEEVIC